MVVAVTVFAGLTSTNETASESFSSAELIQLGAEESVPMARQGMPDIGLPEPGTVLQLGLFSKLDGAEVQQQESSRKGYVPFIEKQVDGNKIQFAVLLGPFYDERQIQATSEALEREGIRHFKRPES
jgi:cell division septation protein DedD